MSLLVDSESWSEALCSGSLAGCPVDSRTVKAGLVNLTSSTHSEADPSA